MSELYTTQNTYNSGCGCGGCGNFFAEPATSQHNDPISVGAAGNTTYTPYSSSQHSTLQVGKWDSLDLSYTFLESAPGYYGSSTEAQGFQKFNSALMSAAKTVLTDIENLTNLNFTEFKQTSTSVGDITFGRADLGMYAGWAYYPAMTLKSGDVWIDDDARYSTPTPGGFEYETVVHELGHALGLQHTFDAKLTGAENSFQYSIMAYANTNPYSGTDKYPTTFMLYDVAALQSMYGANMEYNSGDTTYTLELNKIMTLWDGGGTDTLDGSDLASNLTLNLQDGAFSSIGRSDNFTIAYNAIIENATGGRGNDTLYGNDVANTLNGSEGNDTLYNSLGNDTLDGGSGTDTAVFKGAFSDYLFSFTSQFTGVISGLSNYVSAGINTVKNIEVFKFSDLSKTAAELFSLFGTTAPEPEPEPESPAPENVIDIAEDATSLYATQAGMVSETEYKISNNSASIELSGNTWAKTKMPYNITANTVLEFDYSSSKIGEIQGIGFDTDDKISSNRIFQLYGSQTFGIQNFRDYEHDNAVSHYKINVGQFFTGNMEYLVFVNDHDNGMQDSQSLFSNVSIYEQSGSTENVIDILSHYSPLDLSTASLKDYANNIDDDTVSLQSTQTSLELSGNTWKSISAPYTVTADTVIEFDFKALKEGEIHGFGFDNNAKMSPEQIYQLYGSQTFGIQNFHTYGGSGQTQHYKIKLGDFYKGTFDRLVFVNDHDNGAQDAHSLYSNIKLYEDTGSLYDAIINGTNSKDIFSVNDLPGGGKTYQINDFDVGQDRFDLSHLISGYTSGSDHISDYVRVTSSGNNSIVSVDVNGDTGGENFIDVATVMDVSGLIASEDWIL